MRLLFTAVACLISVSVFGQIISLDKLEHDYGIIEQGSNGECFFEVSNIGKQALVITWKSSCKCVLVQCNNHIIPPGGKKLISVTYDTNRIGPINKSVTITSNATNKSKTVIRIKGKTVAKGFIETNRPNAQENSDSFNNNNSISDNNIRIRLTDHSSIISNIAVIGKESTLCDGSKDDGQGLAELVEGELLGIYGVVERRHLEEILDEQRLAVSGLLLEDSDFAQAGCLAGAQGTVIASYACLQGKTKLQIKLVDCSTSDLYWSATGFDVSEFELMDALRVELNK